MEVDRREEEDTLALALDLDEEEDRIRMDVEDPYMVLEGVVYCLVGATSTWRFSFQAS